MGSYPVPQKERQEYSKKHTSVATNENVVGRPQNNEDKYIIDDMLVGGDTAGTIQILDSDGNAIDGYFFPFGANGGLDLKELYWTKLPTGQGFSYTTTGGGNHRVGFKYHLKTADTGS